MEAILALHGFTGSGQDFAPLAPHLPLPLRAPDLPGHGGPWPCTDALAGLAPLLAPGRVVLGYSMGGRIALHLAHRFPRAVQRLVLIGATPGIADDAARQARIQADRALADRLEADGLEAFLQAWSRKPIIATQARIAAPYRSAMRTRRRQHTAAGLAASLRGMGAGVMPPLWSVLHTLSMPTLAVVGEEDAKFIAIAARMAAAMPRCAVVIIPGAGHCAHLEQPAATGAAIRAWLSCGQP